MTAPETANYIQQFASLGVPGAWIANDDDIDPTTSKIGGFPQYFYLWQKSKEEIICSCKQKMYLLTQINAPLMDERCERNIYVFMCCNSKCTKSNQGWRVIIHKGPRMDDMIYSKHNKCANDDADDHDLHKIIKHNNKKKRNRKTSNAINAESFWNHNLNNNQNIVSAKHDEMDHKMKEKLDGLNDDFSRLMLMQNQLMNEVTKKSKVSQTKKKNKKKQQRHGACGEKPAMKKGSFIPFEITFYDEGYYKNTKNTTNKTVQWKNKEINLKTLMDEEDVKIEEEDNEDDEDLLSDYLQRISVDKTQCVRYCYGDTPLASSKIDSNSIPNCEHCGNQKVFEFQVTSAVLCYLEPKQIHHDWLTVLVFVCPLTCQQSDTQHVVVCNEP